MGKTIRRVVDSPAFWLVLCIVGMAVSLTAAAIKSSLR